MMKRSKDIRDKLAYTLVKYQELSDEVRVAQKNEGEVPYIAQKVGDILSGCRECFDYCAKDIADRFIATSSNQKLAIRYVAGKGKAYFPFFPDQMKAGKLFFELSNSCPELYIHLVDLAAKIESKLVIPNTVTTYGIAAELNELVNAKKHDKITSTRIKSNAATHIVFPGGSEMMVSPMFPWTGNTPDFAADIGAQPMIGGDGVEIAYVREFKLVDNNWEVTRYCLHAIRATSSILAEIYHNHFMIPIDHFDPWETTKPEKVRKAEAVVKAISPIASHAVRVVLSLDGKEIFNTEVSFAGVPNAVGHDDISIANLFVFAFERFYQQRHLSELIRFIHETPDSIACEDLSPRYSELTIPLPVKKDIAINDNRTLSFDEVLFGVGTKFRCDEKVAAPAVGNESLAAIQAITESFSPRFELKTDELGRNLRFAFAD